MPDYDFRSLSPVDFEHLVRDILNADLKLALRGYAPGRDQGIDLRQVADDGSVTVVQCKHYLASSWSTFLGAVKREVSRGKALGADRYLFVTSRDLTPLQQDRIAAELVELGVAHDDVWGRDELNAALSRNPEVEKRHLKLWVSSSTVLETLLGSGRWQRGEATVAQMRDQAKLWVDTPAYAQALEVLEGEGACIVYGPPGVGKTFLAEMVLLSAAYHSWNVIHVSGDIDDAWEALRDDSTDQLFYYNDFLGESELAVGSKNEPTQLAKFIARVRQLRAHKRFILTTREQILQRGAIEYDPLRKLAADATRIGVRIDSYPVRVRAEILFNHLYFSDIPHREHAILAVDSRIISIVDHPSYNPRLIETVIQTAAPTAQDKLSAISDAFDRPDQVWDTSFRSLGPVARQVLLTLATFPPGTWPVETIRALAAIDDPFAWRPALRVLEPTWIATFDGTSAKIMEFANPSCRDYLLELLDDDGVAQEQVSRVRLIDQIVSLTQAAGLGARAWVGKYRPELAHVLQSHRSQLMEVIREELQALGDSVSADTQVKTLRISASLLEVYGQAADTGLLMDHVDQLVAHPGDLRSPDSWDAFALAEHLAHFETEARDRRAALVEQLVMRGVAGMNATIHLEGYELLPDELKAPGVRTAAKQRAQEVLVGELDRLLHDGDDAEAIRVAAQGIEQHARWYRVGIDIGPLLDRADDLAALESQEAPWPPPREGEFDPDADHEEDDIVSVRRIFTQFASE
jgi:Restriction endonuclease